jgi:hypothetical protein
MHRKHYHNWEGSTNLLDRSITGFTCHYCRSHVIALAAMSGVQNRNHCPNCLHSRHVDWRAAGDRMSACKALMVPIGLSMKWSHNKYARLLDGELMLVHMCVDCGKLSINRIAADDRVDRLREIFHASFEWGDEIPQLCCSGIRLLSKEDAWLIDRQLYGSCGN